MALISKLRFQCCQAELKVNGFFSKLMWLAVRLHPVISAQRKIEGRNFEIRKNVLRYDDVMNSQREIIYGQRSKVLQGEDVSESVRTMIHDSITGNATLYLGGETPFGPAYIGLGYSGSGVANLFLFIGTP